MARVRSNRNMGSIRIACIFLKTIIEVVSNRNKIGSWILPFRRLAGAGCEPKRRGKPAGGCFGNAVAGAAEWVRAEFADTSRRMRQWARLVSAGHFRYLRSRYSQPARTRLTQESSPRDSGLLTTLLVYQWISNVSMVLWGGFWGSTWGFGEKVAVRKRAALQKAGATGGRKGRILRRGRDSENRWVVGC